MVTCDNASNNNTMITHLVRKLWQTNPLAELDGNKMHIRCLAHVIHLVAMELLVKIKVIVMICNMYQSLLDLLPMILDQMHRP